MDCRRCSVLFFIILSVLTSLRGDLVQSSYRVVKKLLDQCDSTDDIVKCLKLHTLKVIERAMKLDSLVISEGVTVVRDTNLQRSIHLNRTISDDKILTMDNNQVDSMLLDAGSHFISTRKLQLDISKIVEEGRGKMKKYMMPMMAAMAIKGGLMAMSMKGIAVMAGTALLIGKMALMLSAIMGIKKLLMSSGGQQKTTVEIVKHPQMSYSNSFSGSFEDGGYGGSYGGGGGGGGYGGSSGGYGGGGYHRSLKNTDMYAQEKAYKTQIPKQP